MEVRDVEKAASEAAIMLGYSKLKDLQMSVIVSFVLGRDVFGILPTGYGKHLCYQCLPLVFDKLKSVSSGASIVVVLAPLSLSLPLRTTKTKHETSAPTWKCSQRGEISIFIIIH